MAVNKGITVINTNKKVFRGINFVLLPVLLLIFLIGLAVGYFKGDFVLRWELLVNIVGIVAVVIILLNISFSRYKLTFDDERVTYRHLLRKRNLKFSEVDYARYEYGYEKNLDRNLPSYRFVLYPKKNLEQTPLIINSAALESLQPLTNKLQNLEKLNKEIDYNAN